MTRPYLIWPLKFSPDAPAMIDFYRRLGLQLAFSHDSATFATFNGRAGTLGVHDANNTASGKVVGHTALNLATDDIERAVEELATLGLDVKIWDETYGKQGVVRAPDGRVIGLNETSQEDLYGGYHVHEAEATPTLDVVAVCGTHDMRAEAAFFGSFGFTAPLYDDPWWIALRAGDRSGVIGIHAGEPETRTPRPENDLFGPPYEVRIGFETHLDLEQETDRLRTAGFDLALISEGRVPRIVLTDPDGDEIEIHPAP